MIENKDNDYTITLDTKKIINAVIPPLLGLAIIASFKAIIDVESLKAQQSRIETTLEKLQESTRQDNLRVEQKVDDIKTLLIKQRGDK